MNQSVDFLTYVTLLGTSIGIYLSLVLFFIQSVKNKANFYLAIFVLLLTWVMLPHFLHIFGVLEVFPHVILARVLSPFLGPLFYLYVRSCTQKKFSFRPTLWLHFIFCFINLAVEIPFLLQSGETKINAYLFIHSANERGDILLPILRSIHALFYFVISTRIILQYKKNLTNTTSYIESIYHRWLLAFSAILLVPVVTFLFYAFAENRSDVMLPLFLTLSLFLLFVLTGALIKPSVFHIFPHQMPIPQSREVQKQRYENSTLTEAQKQKYIKKLNEYMVDQQIYTKPDLTLAQLSENMKIPSHHMSQVINEKLGYNFLDFINSHRVKAAQDKLIDPELAHYTIIGIAYESGFNSKSTFYAAFKKVTGMTPSQYRKGQLAVN